MERRRRATVRNYNEDEDSGREIPLRKKSLLSVLTKILGLLKQKDNFGFFLLPVDTSIVVDYLKFITEPMDFSTMEEKLPYYTSLSEFQKDFFLIVENAKKYNAPDTVYYKEAYKLGNYGFPLIEREAKSVASNQELKIFEEEALKRKNDLNLRKRVQQGKKNHKEALEDVITLLFNGDGTFRRKDLQREEQFKRVWFQKVIDSCSVDYFNSILAPSENRIAELFGWSPPQPTDLQCASKMEASFLYHTYGNKRGYTYAASLEKLARDVPFLKDKIDQYLSEITEDGHQIVKKVQETMKIEKEKRVVQVEKTKKGILDVVRRLSEIEYQVQKIIENSVIDNIKKEASDIAPLLKPVSSANMDPSFLSSLTSTSHQSILDDNLKDLQNLVNNYDPQEFGSERMASLEKIRRRLVHLVSLSPPSEFGGAQNQSMLSASRGFSGNRAIPAFSKRTPEPSQVLPNSATMNPAGMPSLNLTQLQQMQQMRSAMRSSGGTPYGRHGMNVGTMNVTQGMRPAHMMNPTQAMSHLPQAINPQQIMIPPQAISPQTIMPPQGINPNYMRPLQNYPYQQKKQ